MRLIVLKITGKVQGVGFRRSAEIVAKQLSLTGWVRNNSDGSVELALYGNEEDIYSFIDWAWDGPADAQVDDLVEEWVDDQNPDFEEPEDFKVL